MLLSALKWGIWLGQLMMQGHTLPFNFDLKEEKGKPQMIIHNATERIICDEIEISDDSVFIRLPFFDSEFRLLNDGDTMTGIWINHGRKENNIIPFSAIHNVSTRFSVTNEKGADFNGKWETWFDADSPDSSVAVGIFKENGQRVTGTFLTESGDHRYLEGVADGDSIRLSVFDGVHAWLYLAVLKDSLLEGMYYSGIHYKAPFHAWRNKNARLHNADSLAFVTGPVNFTFPDKDSNMVSLTDAPYRNKVVILQIMGSWCPNCMDESVLFNKVYEERKKEGLEIIALAFERNQPYAVQRTNIERMLKRLGLKYKVLLAGISGKENVSKSLPFIKNFSSFPTSVFIDRQGNVAKVHTGFSGPATGEAYEIYKKDLKNSLDRLLR